MYSISPAAVEVIHLFNNSVLKDFFLLFHNLAPANFSPTTSVIENREMGKQVKSFPNIPFNYRKWKSPRFLHHGCGGN